MGNWAIIIEGIGCHHNKDYPNDADKMARQMAQQLVEAGHAVTRASFVHGGAEDLLPRPEQPAGA